MNSVSTYGRSDVPSVQCVREPQITAAYEFLLNRFVPIEIEQTL